MNEDILPCAHCGCSAGVLITPRYHSFNANQLFAVRCHNEQCGIGTMRCEDEQEAVEVWNQRA